MTTLLMMNEQNPNDSCATIRCTKRCDDDSGGSSCYFDNDTLIEILSRLPQKTLLRFMCVSKSWHNLISNSLTSSPVSGFYYCTNTIRPKNKQKGYIHLTGTCNTNCGEVIESWAASLGTSDVNLTLAHYCNGLFLLSNEKDVPAAYHVCNPASNQCVALPEPPLDPNVKDPYMSLSVLAFDPDQSPHYKVLRFSGQDPVYVDIFSSKERRWIDCNVAIRAFSLLDMWFKDFIFMDGALHFLLRRDSLCSFHVEEVCIRAVKLPKARRSFFGGECIGKSEGHLFYSAYDSSEMHIWMLQDPETHEWVLKHTIRKEEIEKHPVSIVPEPRYYPFSLHPLTFHPDLEVIFIQIEGKIISYHFGSKKNEDDRLGEICTIEIHRYVNMAIPYKRCLYSLDEMREREQDG